MTVTDGEDRIRGKCVRLSSTGVYYDVSIATRLVANCLP